VWGSTFSQVGQSNLHPFRSGTSTQVALATRLRSLRRHDVVIIMRIPSPGSERRAWLGNIMPTVFRPDRGFKGQVTARRRRSVRNYAIAALRIRPGESSSRDRDTVVKM
jgi:hypothetical protein